MNDFASAYIRGTTPGNLLSQSFRCAETRTNQVRQAASRVLSQELRNLIREQNEALPKTQGRLQALTALQSKSFAFVITGQQPGLFLGPLLTLYKALSAIAIARQLQLDTGITTIPLFWLQSEDHDFDEVNQCVVKDSAGNLQNIQLATRTSSPRVSLEHERILDTRAHAITGLEEAIKDLPFARQISPLLGESYGSTNSLVAAFASLLSLLLKDEPLLLFNPRCDGVARLAQPLYRTIIEQEPTITSKLIQQGEKILASGFEQQVHIRPDSPLCFFHPESAQGPRYRLSRENDRWRCIGSSQSVSHRELLSILENDPLRLSSSALLRPLIQEYLFPSAGYIGGPAELNYFAQIDPLFGILNIPTPIVYPRSFFRCSEAKDRRLLEKCSLSATSNSLDDELVQLSSNVTDTQSFDTAVDSIALQFRTLSDILISTDPTLKEPAAKTEERTLNQLASLRTRYQNALRRSDFTTTERILWLRSQFFPLGIEQERILSPLYFLAKYGDDFLTRVKSSIRVFEPELREVAL